ncbi:hypothetical protein [Acidovorax sp. SUPP2825]|nr:hypothetical protein [Acidovorax sp. SUPP2825]GKS94980.1 hypothetical protein AVAK2825_10615 [Acidovorax sp. SUPP2825]
MFSKILMANRGENGRIAAVSVNGVARAACARGFAAEVAHV